MVSACGEQESRLFVFWLGPGLSLVGAAGDGGAAEVAPGGAVERGAGIFGTPFGGAGQPRAGIAFGPGRANRMPDQGTPEYQQLVARMRGLGR